MLPFLCRLSTSSRLKVRINKVISSLSKRSWGTLSFFLSSLFFGLKLKATYKLDPDQDQDIQYMANKKLIYCAHLQTGPGPLSTSACCATIRTMWSIVAWATGSMGWIEIMVHLDNNCYCITIAIGRQQKRAFWCTIIDSITSGERCCGKFFKMSTYQSREFGSSFPTSYLLVVFTKRQCNGN